ncbi:MAG: hypothetical protein ACE5FC_05880 [Myxococcota bacterium]
MADTPAPEITVDGKTYRYTSTLKSDFFSVNYLYESGGTAYVLKISRFRFIGAFLFQWLARLFHHWEWRVYSRLDGTPWIPPLAGRYGKNGLLHEFIPGMTLMQFIKKRKREGKFDPRSDFGDDFFPRLESTLAEVHRREVAYADMAKLENVIVDDRGKPWLIDFQISWPVPPSGPLRPIALAIYRIIAREDRYHLLKYKGRYRPDQMTGDERALRERRSFLNRLHKYLLRKPFHFFKHMIYPKGSNEVVRWKFRKGETRGAEARSGDTPDKGSR